MESTEPARIHSAIILLGKIANPEDAGLASKFLTHEKAAIREAAAVALGRLGPAALPHLERALEEAIETKNPQGRAVVMAAIPHCVDRKTVQKLLEKGLADSDPWVRHTAAAMVISLSRELGNNKKKIVKRVKKKLRKDPDRTVRLAEKLLK